MPRQSGADPNQSHLPEAIPGHPRLLLKCPTRGHDLEGGPPLEQIVPQAIALLKPGQEPGTGTNDLPGQRAATERQSSQRSFVSGEAGDQDLEMQGPGPSGRGGNRLGLHGERSPGTTEALASVLSTTENQKSKTKVKFF